MQLGPLDLFEQLLKSLEREKARQQDRRGWSRCCKQIDDLVARVSALEDARLTKAREKT